MGTKFNINRDPVTDEEINSHKDFDELVKKFKADSIQKARSDVGFSKKKKITYTAVIAGITVVCTVSYFAFFNKNTTQNTTHDTKTTITQHTTPSKTNKAFVAPPIAKLNIPYTSYTVKAEQGSEITHKPSQSKIKIPKKAFINKIGEDIVGDVQIQYREFHDQADIIASGIPMEYDSAGIKRTFESAGMFDIKGFQNGEPVFINPKKQITVELTSSQPADRFNQYVLDTVAKNWVYLKRDVPVSNGTSKQKTHSEPAQEDVTTIALQKKIDEIPPKIETEKINYTKKVNQLPVATVPSKPVKSVKGRPRFELEVDYKEFPELAAFKNATFEIGEENKNYSPKLADITWSSAEISEGPQKGKNYLLTLKLGSRVEKLIAYPALNGADYDNALKVYESKFTDYKNLIVKREAQEKKLKEEFEAKQAAYVEEQKKLSEQLVREKAKIWKENETKLKEEFAVMRSQEKVTRIFNVSNFNIYNSDCATNDQFGTKINPIYVINNGNSTIRPQIVYLVCHSRNQVYNLSYGQINYDPTQVYSVFVIESDKLYICKKETFYEIATAHQNKIPLTELTADIHDADDLRKAMGI